MPPASAHLALMPVPAPPPMIGLPAATWARSRFKHSSRVKRLMFSISTPVASRGNRGYDVTRPNMDEDRDHERGSKQADDSRRVFRLLRSTRKPRSALRTRAWLDG